LFAALSQLPKEPRLIQDSSEVTRLLKVCGRGDRAALDRLTPLVYEQLRRLAAHYMRKEGGGHQLQATALVHEAYLRLVQADDVEWRDRVHFFAVSARMMRRILVDAARRRTSAKRGGRTPRDEHSTIVDLDSLPAADDRRAAELCAVDDALTALAQLDRRRAQVVELRFFGGLSVEETAEVLKVSPETVMRDWKLARA
jgi:RNA polymerase sigma factor (TIGR02999 family)